MTKVKKAFVEQHRTQHYPKINAKHKLAMDRNENPLLPSKRVQDAIYQEFNQLSRYPENSGFKLRNALSERWDLNPDYFLIGNGSFEILSLLALVFLDQDSEVIVPEGTFIWHKRFSQFNGAKVINVPLNQNFQIHLSHIVDAITPQTKIIWLTNPFNPTGTILKKQDLLNFCSKVSSDIIIAIDEAYIEFANLKSEATSKQFVIDFPNVILLRTFSKFYRLAALRIGYAVAQPELIQTILPYRIPPNHNRLGAVAAIESLHDKTSQKETFSYIKNEKEYLITELEALDFKVIQSETNFLFISLEKHPSDFIEKLAEEVIFKDGQFFGFPNYFRITIGNTEQNRELIRLIKKIINY
ncbi:MULTISPECIES: aminotransferase class I/II-fold pyridoxal phosphate-dependent enzyme [unclassified Enterococcus]|uniref:pyridoxal phosphate-dependent aminotransferase n=1 Tax=unclassified Enterococcus TaxID=2608891 RepID=UPI001553471C|nr:MULTISPECIES: aminotransferase class I/II-fold pyridoxal phosphate-dependent enzyme [unclassified Enterococcus]MBS7578092.1 aminotransferase class I/II-fold pyridoxal phosphate-dependent enzyme [Enterococcus sp. MMGLQ5-2]MBS7585352.1 aminotransferase class I/II-fold pyridoxal phosphate-dependent enzyme [Enterococcus sp. MMGLQ5-1]NPD13209.1 aminotransferase class I/II-fold pyridoxal phosphate-dependent enzyme [Enterococcus sp. MMGLQ5-1]NPD37923.1 aminotransferase class I/II-fold pyridoxal pho